MKRIYHPYTKWEEFHAGMWNKHSPEIEEKMLGFAIEFTGDANRYGAAMLRVIEEWPYSCEHNLTCKGMNRQAWIGHAAICLEHGIPEHVTRAAWNELTDQQRIEANAMADIAIAAWEEKWLKQA